MQGELRWQVQNQEGETLDKSLSRERLVDFTKNGARVKPTFSAQEMTRRLQDIRGYMASKGIDTALFTSYHNINYYSDFLYC